MLTARTMEAIKYYAFDLWTEIADPTFSFCPLFGGSPLKIIALISAYVYFVTIFGPKMMKNRKPMDIKPVIFAYNAALSIINGFFFLVALKFTDYGAKCYGCRGKFDFAADPEGDMKLTFAYLYAWSKILDFVDTIFFVFRKKFSHITVLHVYHHSAVAFLVWFTLNFGLSELIAVFPILNSFVHTVMYAYYALSTLGPSVRPYLWWKKYITKLQIGHLLFMFMYGVVHVSVYPMECFPSPYYVYIGFSQGIIIIALFVNFYVQNYIINRRPQSISSVPPSKDAQLTNGNGHWIDNNNLAPKLKSN